MVELPIAPHLGGAQCRQEGAQCRSLYIAPNQSLERQFFGAVKGKEKRKERGRVKGKGGGGKVGRNKGRKKEGEEGEEAMAR